jgi:FAD/FMN-containing dehydrogenase
MDKNITRRNFISKAIAATGGLILAPHQAALSAGKKSSVHFDSLAHNISGDVIVPTADSACGLRDSMVWNAIKPDRMPDAIVRVLSERDIVQALSFARRNNLKVAVRGGGHNFYGLSIRNGGMLIDLSQLTEVSIDAAKRTASIQPIVTNRDLAARLAEQNLAFPVGHCGSVPMSGYLLNGGFPFNAAEWGPACDSVEALHMVTADGQSLVASKEQNIELFYAARGAGPGFFAVITRFDINLKPSPQAMMESTYFCEYKKYREVANEVAAIAEKLPPNMELTIALATPPPYLAVECESSNGRACIFSATVFGHNEEEAKSALAPFEESSALAGCLSKKTFQPSSFKALFDFHDKLFPTGHRYEVDIICSDAHPADFLSSVSEQVLQSPSPKSMVACIVSPGKVRFLQPHRGRAFSMSGNLVGGCWAIWNNSADDAKNLAWHADIASKFQPFVNQHYIGESNIVRSPDIAKGCYGNEQWQKLEALRSKYDPQGIFFRLHEGLS